MKTKTFSVLASLALCVAVSATAQITQYVTITSGNSLSLQTNQLVSVIGYDWSDISAYSVNSTYYYTSPSIIGYLSAGSTVNLTPCYLRQYTATSSSSQVAVSSQIPQMATGMTNVVVTGGWATFKIETPATATVVSNYVPADAIVIPSSATGNVQIILESSPDLVNWTAASPGTYGASAGTNRFFRVRAAVNP